MKNIVIIPNKTKDKELKVTKQLIETLSPSAKLYMSTDFSDIGFQIYFLENDRLFDNADCVIVLGGDGTILNAAEPCGRKNIPIMGINLGKVGFMAEVNVCDIEKACKALLSGHYSVEKRMMMKVTVLKKDKKEYHSLNDVVISKTDSPMISVEIHNEKEKINGYSADGLIIATPTGSTGYSLSAGGPVADPTMELFIASPICAHMLHARPALIPCDRPITLSLSDELGLSAEVTIDGNIVDNITIGDKVIIEKSQYSAKIIKIGTQSFYDVLIEKLR